MSVFNVISMLGGLALFLYGMKIMGDGLKKESTGSFKLALEKVTGNAFMGFLVGAGLTAIIQSATATIVIVSGLVGAGIMTLNQSIGIILGANVGTTITGQIIRLLDVDASGTQWLNLFKPSTLAPVAAVIGILFVMFIKRKNSDTIGTIAMGFGILFTGLLNMTSAVAPLSESESFLRLFTSFGDQPFFGFLAGFAVAFILQSSSATIGILQALSITGALTFSSVYPIIIGIYLGDCVTTAIVCSIGTKADAKRTGIVNILFNLGEIILISVAVNILHGLGVLEPIWSKVLNSGGIANTHTIFNLSCAILLLPLAGTFGRIAKKVIKDDPADEKRKAEIQALDPALFTSPALALFTSYKALCAMNEIVQNNLPVSLSMLQKYDADKEQTLDSDENYLDELEDELNAYLSSLSPHLCAEKQKRIQSYYLQCITDFERAGDHIIGIMKCAKEIGEKNAGLSDEAYAEMTQTYEVLCRAMKLMDEAFTKQNVEAAKDVEAYAYFIDELVDTYRDRHLDRVFRGECYGVSGPIFLDVLMHMGRIGAACSNIAIHTLARHNPSVENYEHAYMDSMHRGDDANFNRILAALRHEYMDAYVSVEDRHPNIKSLGEN